MHLIVKICGLSTPGALDAALESGADMVGFVFFPPSPRHIGPELARSLSARVKGRAAKVALVVDAGPGQLNVISAQVSPDLWQLHGLETPTRCGEIKEWRRRPVMKAFGVARPADLAAIPDYAAIADHILLDAKPPKDAAYPGGHGQPFDWNILSALPPDQPFMLSGGLSPENVGEAIRTIRGMGLKLEGVDVSSGVESAPGVKDAGKIRAFVAAAREAGGS
jgi:phosphoribosylanthranilate isomerase